MARHPVPCHVCGSARHLPFLERRGFPLVRCADCGLYYVTPQPTIEELRVIYGRYYLATQWERGEVEYGRALVRMIRRLRPTGRVLDIGCGNGQLCAFLRAAGYDTLGLELTESKGVEEARTIHGVNVFIGSVGTLADREGGEKAFDVCILSNVLEHFLDPVDTLRNVRRLLSDAGVVLVVVPNVFLHLAVGAVRKFLRRPNPYLLEVHPTPLVAFQPPLHLTSFSPRTLRLLLHKAGFRVAQMCHAPPVFSGRPGFVPKDFVKRAVVACSNIVCRASMGRWLPGYSSLAVAMKAAGPAGGERPCGAMANRLSA